MKKGVIILWIIFAVCLVLTIVFGFLLKKVEPEYEEVKVKVVSSETLKVKNKKTSSTYNFYEVKVEYNGETYDLGNPHSSSEYPKGKTVKAYLSNGKIYANIEGIKNDSPVGIAYFVFLFGSIISFFLALFFWNKLSQSKKLQSQE